MSRITSSPLRMQVKEWLPQFKAFLHSLTNNQVKQVAITVGMGAVGITIAANYFFKFISKRRKKILSQKRQIIQTIPQLKAAHVRIKNLNHVESILSNLVYGGKKRLQIVSDFDRTISLCEFEGKACFTSNSLFESSRFIPSEMRDRFTELRHYYMSIEHDPKLTRQQKLPYMVEWWKKSFDLVIESGVTKEDIKEIVHNSTVHLKSGLDYFFFTTERYDIPLLIFSAGLGDIITEWIISQCGSFKNQKVISNFMVFDEQTHKVTSFQDQLIHVYNKNESVLEDTEYGHYIENRHNLMLLGDSPGDIDMMNGLTNINNVLKIGFLNHDVEELLPKYMDLYDIVTINDPTFDIPNAILKSII